MRAAMAQGEAVIGDACSDWTMSIFDAVDGSSTGIANVACWHIADAQSPVVVGPRSTA